MRLGGCVIAFRWFDDQAITDRLGGDFNPYHLSIDECADPLDVGLEGSASDTGNFSAGSAEMPCLATAGDTAARVGSFAGEITYPRHNELLNLQESISIAGLSIFASAFFWK